MNVIELLKTDHETVSACLDSSVVKSRSQDAQKRREREDLTRSSKLRAAVEEELFYPRSGALRT
jgi:hypothetical protein